MKIENQGNLYHNDHEQTGYVVEDFLGFWINFNKKRTKGRSYISGKNPKLFLVFKYYML